MEFLETIYQSRNGENADNGWLPFYQSPVSKLLGCTTMILTELIFLSQIIIRNYYFFWNDFGTFLIIKIQVKINSAIAVESNNHSQSPSFIQIYLKAQSLIVFYPVLPFHFYLRIIVHSLIPQLCFFPLLKRSTVFMNILIYMPPFGSLSVWAA